MRQLYPSPHLRFLSLYQFTLNTFPLTNSIPCYLYTILPDEVLQYDSERATGATGDQDKSGLWSKLDPGAISPYYVWTVIELLVNVSYQEAILWCHEMYVLLLCYPTLVHATENRNIANAIELQISLIINLRNLTHLFSITFSHFFL